MNSGELKDYLKACIDCEKVIYEVPKIQNRIDKTIDQLDIKIDRVNEMFNKSMPKYPAPVHTVSLPSDSPYTESDIIPYLINIIKNENLYPNKFTVVHSDYFLSVNPSVKARFKGTIKWDSDKVFFLGQLREYLSKKNSPYKVIDEIIFPIFYKSKFDDACVRAKSMMEQGNNKRKEKYVQEQRKYEENKKSLIAEYNRKLSDHNKKYNNQKLVLTGKKQLLEKERVAFDVSYSEASANLSKLMSLNVIHEKYRDLACLCSMYEYLDTGRCTELIGPFGAYQRYEEELSTGKIINSLDRIEGKLNQIMNNQRTLAMTMAECTKRINESIDNMNNSIGAKLNGVSNSVDNLSDSVGHLNSTLGSINDSLYATQYHTERIAKMTEYVNSVKFAKGEFIGFENNYPY